MESAPGQTGAVHKHSGSKRFKGIQVAKIRGIPVEIHWSLLLALPVFAFALGGVYLPLVVEIPPLWSLIWGIVMAVVLFGSVLLHELSHSLMAIRYGIDVKRIILMPIGGLSQMETDPERPGQELAVTVVGPVTNFIIAAPFVALTLTGVVPEVAPGLSQVVLWAGAINILLGVFNLFLPAYPMDGGRVLRSLLAYRVGRLRATRYAATTGRVIAVFMGLFGFFIFGLGGILLIIIAFFIFMGATMERRLAEYEQALQGTRVEDLMTRDPVVTHPGDTLEDLARTIQDTKHFAFPVVDDDDRLLGCITMEDLQGIPSDVYSRIPISRRMREDVVTVEGDSSAGDALREVLTKGIDHIAVVKDEHLLGFFTRTDLEKSIQIAQATQKRRKALPAG